MKFGHLINKTLSLRILLLVPAMLFTLSVGPANSASDSGAITLVLRDEPVNIDPAFTSRSATGHVLLKNVVETLTEINPSDSSVNPRLATSWKQIDTHTWHLTLRKGVKFHNGENFNAEVVAFNIKRLYEKNMALGIKNKFFPNLKMEGKALDSHILEVKTDKFEPLLPILMGFVTICSPNTSLDKLTRNPIGTGPYKFVKWDAGMQIILERFDEYWGRKPEVQKATYIWRGESSVRAAMVQIGEADLVLDIASQDANRPDMDYSYLNSETSYFRISVWEPPLNDRRVRMALNYAIDRNAIRGSILSRDVVPATQLVVPNIVGHKPDLKPWPHDPQKARQLLDEARRDGVPIDKEILLVGRIGAFPNSNELMEAVMAMYKAVGLNVKLRVLDYGVYVPYRNKPFIANVGPYLLLNMHDNSAGDAVFTVFQMYHRAGNTSPISDKELDDLIEKAQVSTGEERKNLWRTAFRRVHEEVNCDVMLFHMVGYCRVGKRINFKPTLRTSGEVQLEQITFKQ